MDISNQERAATSIHCPICGKEFVRKWTLSRHLMAQHDSSLNHFSDPGESEDESKEQKKSEDEHDEDDSSETESESDDDKASNEGDSDMDDTDSEEDYSTELSEKNIDCLLHLIGAAELGKLQITSESLQCFIKPGQFPNDGNLDNEVTIVSNTLISFLKKLLLAAKEGDMVLTNSLYLDIINAIEKAAV